jgi:hypothetical protein
VTKWWLTAKMRLNFGRSASPVSTGTYARKNSERPKFRDFGRSPLFAISSHIGCASHREESQGEELRVVLQLAHAQIDNSQPNAS